MKNGQILILRSSREQRSKDWRKAPVEPGKTVNQRKTGAALEKSYNCLEIFWQFKEALIES